MSDKANKFKVDGVKATQEVLAAGKAAFARWKPGEPIDKLAQTFLGELNSSAGRAAGLYMPSPAMVRQDVAQELRDVAAKMPKGSTKRAAFLEAADLAEQGPR